MSAKHGSTRTFGTLGCLLAVALLASALFATAASAKKRRRTPTSYIAMGDSLSFGYTKQQRSTKTVRAASPATRVRRGYVERYWPRNAR